MSTIGTQSSPFFFGWVVIKGGRCGVEGWGCDVGSVVRGAWGCDVRGEDVM